MFCLMKENEQNLIIIISCKMWHNTVCESIQEEAAYSFCRSGGAKKKGVKKTVTKFEILGFED